MKDINDLMKQAQQVQANMQRMQEELAQLEVTGESGAGLVQVVLNGRYEARRLNIDDSLVGKELGQEKELLEDLIAAAINDAVHKVEQNQKEKMGGLAKGFGLPPGFKLPL